MTTAAHHAAGDLARGAHTLLFVPGDRPERFEKAAAAGADLVVVDLEDAVPAANKEKARAEAAAWIAAGHTCAVRINAADTEHFDADVSALAGSGAAIMLPKAEDPAAAARLADTTGSAVIALIETARGVLAAASIASAPGVVRLAIGTFDLAAQLGVDPTDTEALAASRGALVLASAAAGLTGPVDGVTGSVDDPDRVRADVAYARRLGFAGKLVIHPKQLDPTSSAFAPSADDIAWARRIIEALGTDGVAVVDGQMVDKPVVDRARSILDRA
ncbi:CoA ester lyase [Gordonia sihwensis]|uniref:HpcH/HpaI aldolase/citrate lyase family protein n=1 Tax=Gordonia TaxID=2053 RepID=UPI001C92BC21|nr:CoA ester lyase [Gordonia sihwensis]MBY4568706.1 CoA ester lyase [Gordonia sihwensis]WFN92731.1 CoA ester lyase [Gordonia sihwensis]